MEEIDTTETEKFYWIAINRASAAHSQIAMPKFPTVFPIPEQLWGFRTRQQQLDAVNRALFAPTAELYAWINGELYQSVVKGEVAYYKPENPQPPGEVATWLLSGTGNPV